MECVFYQASPVFARLFWDFKKHTPAMYLIDWLTANLLMGFMVLVIFGTAAVMLYVAFTKKEGAADSVDKYQEQESEEESELVE
jgi:hypothetical protein